MHARLRPWMYAAMQMSRSVIIEIGRPASSTTGTLPQAQRRHWLHAELRHARKRRRNALGRDAAYRALDSGRLPTIGAGGMLSLAMLVGRVRLELRGGLFASQRKDDPARPSQGVDLSLLGLEGQACFAAFTSGADRDRSVCSASAVSASAERGRSRRTGRGPPLRAGRHRREARSWGGAAFSLMDRVRLGHEAPRTMGAPRPARGRNRTPLVRSRVRGMVRFRLEQRTAAGRAGRVPRRRGAGGVRDRAPKANATHLGFIVEDQPPSLSVDRGHDRVDLYGYMSMAIATMQVQDKEIAELKRQVHELQSSCANKR